MPSRVKKKKIFFSLLKPIVGIYLPYLYSMVEYRGHHGFQYFQRSHICGRCIWSSQVRTKIIICRVLKKILIQITQALELLAPCTSSCTSPCTSPHLGKTQIIGSILSSWSLSAKDITSIPQVKKVPSKNLSNKMICPRKYPIQSLARAKIFIQNWRLIPRSKKFFYW